MERLKQCQMSALNLETFLRVRQLS